MDVILETLAALNSKMDRLAEDFKELRAQVVIAQDKEQRYAKCQ